MVEAFAISDPGLVRKTNEDSYICNDRLGLYVVADGMGGHSAGEVASRLAVEAIEGFIARSHDDSDFSWPYGIDPQLSLGGNRLRTAVHLANRRVFRTSESRDDYAGMGTTVTAVLVSGETLSYAHVGDSRLYAFTDGALVQVTQDDSWVATLMANDPSLKKADLAHHPMRHVLTNVVGAREQVEVQLGELPVSHAGSFLICSDGLHGMADESAIAGILGRGGPLDALAHALLGAARDGGGHDNITALVLRTSERR
jgi:PPM family protein phosphatase